MSAHPALSATASTEPGTPLPARTRLDAYEVETLIAKSSRALVYRAVRIDTGQVFAIKEFFPAAFALRHGTNRVAPRPTGSCDRFEAGRRAFVDEARSLARFEHPSLVRVLGLFEANGTVYRVMRFTPGPTLLAHRLALGSTPAVQDLRLWVDGLLGALATLHQAGCVHGAVTPANVLLRPGEHPLLLGFAAVADALASVARPGASGRPGDAADAAPGRAPPAGGSATTVADVDGLAAMLRYCIEGPCSTTAPLADAWRREGGCVPIPPDIARLLRTLDACRSDPDERPRSVPEFRRRLADEPLAAAAHVAAADGAQRVDDRQPRDADDCVARPMAVPQPGADPPADEHPAAAAADDRGDRVGPGDDASAGGCAEAEHGQAADAVEVVAWPSAIASETAGRPARPEPRLAEPEVVPMAPPPVARRAEPPAAAAVEPALAATVEPAVAPQAEPTIAPLAKLAVARLAEPAVEDMAPAPPDGRVGRPLPRLRRSAAVSAVALIAVFGVAATVWGGRRAEPLATVPTLPVETPAEALPPARPDGPAAALAPVATEIPAAPVAAGARPAPVNPKSRPAPPALRPPAPAGPAGPAAPRKAVAVAAKAQPPLEACDGRTGFALYQCMQLQCAKPAAVGHADCASLR